MNQPPSSSVPPTPIAGAVSDTGQQIAEILLEQGVLSDEQLRYAYRIRGKLGEQYSLVQVLKELGYLDEGQLRDALRENQQTVPLGNLMVELGYLRPVELRAALQAQQDPEYQGKRLGEVLLEKRLIQEHQLIEVLADQLGFANLEPNFTDLDQELLNQVKPDWCRRHQAVPVRREGEQVVVAFRNPLDTNARQAAAGAFGQVSAAIATKRAIDDTLKAYEDSRRHVRSRATVSAETQITSVVDALIVDALEVGASDIHIEPMRQLLRVRFRRDGILMLHKEVGKNLAAGIASRLKVLSKADIAEKRRHQGGGFSFNDPKSGRRSDVRVSFYATIFGEKIVMRLLSRKAELLDIKEVGMAPRMLERFMEDALDFPSGVILITGPTGSGKTTSLYGCINYLNDMERSIITAEDPVEYVIDGISQCSLNPKINLTFEETLRHMVRQDPDVIVLGEIRDQFSAESAIQAALTGHKVLTTFHTEDSIGGLLRLMNMEIETFLISSTVVSVLAQRLLRHVCEHCAETYRPNAHELQRLGCRQSDLAGATFRAGRGCQHCHYTGYAGRVGVFELLVLNEMVKDAILSKKTSTEIRRISVETSGLITLLEDGLAKAAQGLTSVQEVLRHLPRLGRPRPLKDIFRLAGKVHTH
jgi:type IV pilus assembly protein PilB